VWRHPQQRISRPGGLFTSSWTYPVLIFLAAASLTGVVEVEMSGQARASSLPPPLERSIPQGVAARPAATASMPTTDRLGNHYLMLVNTAVANQMDAPKMAQFDRSPYDGLAVSFADAYDTSPVIPVAAMQSQIASWKKIHFQGHLAMGLSEPHDRRKRRGRKSIHQSALLPEVSGTGSERQSRRRE
jgi:hypothetical protein